MVLRARRNARVHKRLLAHRLLLGCSDFSLHETNMLVFSFIFYTESQMPFLKFLSFFFHVYPECVKINMRAAVCFLRPLPFCSFKRKL